ncbi:MAG: elongation factor P hydroxylase [Halioglobus sp.]
MSALLRRNKVQRELFEAARLERVFDACFTATLHTTLRGGAEEPLYQPATKSGDCHVLYYRADYFASALHEVAHWCIAGADRRQQVDFGYWYAPDGRSEVRQQEFEAVEVKPQTLEWYFSRACGYPFQLSMDNLDGGGKELAGTSVFAGGVYEQARLWQSHGLAQRAGVFFAALCSEFGTLIAARDLHFDLAELN